MMSNIFSLITVEDVVGCEVDLIPRCSIEKVVFISILKMRGTHL